MNSMWDLLFDSPIPMDRVARIVTSSAPWWAQPLTEDEKARSAASKKRRVTIADYVSIMQPPPHGLLDYRGRRGRFHIICGFAHRKNFVSSISSGSRLAMELRDKFGTSVARDILRDKTHANRMSTWYCLRADGEVIMVNSKSLRNKLRNLDDSYMEDVRLGYSSAGDVSSEWAALDSIQVASTPAANNRSRITPAS